MFLNSQQLLWLQMMAMETKENNEIITADREVLNACTFDKLDMDKLPMFDERMYLADKWRKEKFTDTHPEIARAMGYEI